MQMYCSELGGWLWQADAIESRTGKILQAKGSNFLLLFSLLEYAVVHTVKVSSFFHKQQYKFVTKWSKNVPQL